MIPHLLRCQGFAVVHYGFTLGRLGPEASSTFAQLRFYILEKVLPLNSDAEKLRDALAILMPYSVEIRYPDDWYIPSEGDAKEAREAAEKVLRWLKIALPEIFEKS